MNDQTPPPSHAMWNIPQSEHYSVFIDETVSPNSRYTHFVAVAFPDLKKAPAPKGKHATSEGIETLKSDFNALQHSECGILGTTFSLQKTNSQWLSSVLKTAKTVLAILCRRNREAPPADCFFLCGAVLPNRSAFRGKLDSSEKETELRFHSLQSDARAADEKRVRNGAATAGCPF